MIPRYFIVAERDHEIQNPTSEEKLLLLGRRIRLGPDSRVLDIASGRGGPALLLAQAFGCRIDGVEIAPEFQAAAVEQAEARGLEHLVSFRRADASLEELEREESMPRSVWEPASSTAAWPIRSRHLRRR